MTRFLTLISFITIISYQAQANSTFTCIDKAGKSAGEIVIVKQTKGESFEITYSTLKNSSDGWELLVTEDGNVYNNDMTVQQGRKFFVGKFTTVDKQILISIQGRQLACK